MAVCSTVQEGSHGVGTVGPPFSYRVTRARVHVG